MTKTYKTTLAVAFGNAHAVPMSANVGARIKDMNIMKKNCSEPAAYRFTWPGKDESFICVEHSMKVRSIADAIGLPLQLIILSIKDVATKECFQKVDAT